MPPAARLPLSRTALCAYPAVAQLLSQPPWRLPVRPIMRICQPSNRPKITRSPRHDGRGDSLILKLRKHTSLDRLPLHEAHQIFEALEVWGYVLTAPAPPPAGK